MDYTEDDAEILDRLIALESDRVPGGFWNRLTEARIESALARFTLSEHCPGGCIYCGEEAAVNDHLLPLLWTGTTLRRYVPTVPACWDCNSRLSGILCIPIADRAHEIARHLHRRFGKLLAVSWSDEELATLGKGPQRRPEGL